MLLHNQYAPSRVVNEVLSPLLLVGTLNTLAKLLPSPHCCEQLPRPSVTARSILERNYTPT